MNVGKTAGLSTQRPLQCNDFYHKISIDNIYG